MLDEKTEGQLVKTMRYKRRKMTMTMKTTERRTTWRRQWQKKGQAGRMMTRLRLCRHFQCQRCSCRRLW